VDDHRRYFADPPGSSWWRPINQGPHTTPGLSRRCRARRGISIKHQQKVLELSWNVARFGKISNLNLDHNISHVFRLSDCLLNRHRLTFPPSNCLAVGGSIFSSVRGQNCVARVADRRAATAPTDPPCESLKEIDLRIRSELATEPAYRSLMELDLRSRSGGPKVRPRGGGSGFAMLTRSSAAAAAAAAAAVCRSSAAAGLWDLLIGYGGLILRVICMGVCP